MLPCLLARYIPSHTCHGVLKIFKSHCLTRINHTLPTFATHMHYSSLLCTFQCLDCNKLRSCSVSPSNQKGSVHHTKFTCIQKDSLHYAGCISLAGTHLSILYNYDDRSYNTMPCKPLYKMIASICYKHTLPDAVT